MNDFDSIVTGTLLVQFNINCSLPRIDCFIRIAYSPWGWLTKSGILIDSSSNFAFQLPDPLLRDAIRLEVYVEKEADWDSIICERGIEGPVGFGNTVDAACLLSSHFLLFRLQSLMESGWLALLFLAERDREGIDCDEMRVGNWEKTGGWDFSFRKESSSAGTVESLQRDSRFILSSWIGDEWTSGFVGDTINRNQERIKPYPEGAFHTNDILPSKDDDWAGGLRKGGSWTGVWTREGKSRIWEWIMDVCDLTNNVYSLD